MVRILYWTAAYKHFFKRFLYQKAEFFFQEDIVMVLKNTVKLYSKYTVVDSDLENG